MQDEQDDTFSSFDLNAESATIKISSGELTDGKGEVMFPLLHVYKITVSYYPTLSNLIVYWSNYTDLIFFAV